MAMGAAKIRALMQWCKQQVEGYPGVEVSNFTKSFRDGLAFCAIIHRFRPELVDFYALSKENIQDNNQLAYSVAENELGIPALLDAEDMVAMTVPDRLSVITYVSQYYNYFCNKTPAGGPHVVAAESARSSVRKKKQSSPAPQTGVLSEVHGSELCAICHKTVYMLERHHLDDQLVHRSCLRRNQMKDIGERVKSLERGAHLKRNFGSSNVSPPLNAVKDPTDSNSNDLDEEGSASKRRTSIPRTSTPISSKGPEAPLRPNGSARHEPNSLVGHPSPVIPPPPPDLSTLPPPPPPPPPPAGCPPSREVTAPAQTRIIHPSEGKPAVRPHSPLVPPAPSPTPHPSRPQAESSLHQELTEKLISDSSILRSRSPTPRLASSVHKGDSTSHYLHHKRRAPAPPAHPVASTPPPRPPSIRTLPNDMGVNRNSALSETEENAYPESLNPFCEPTPTHTSPPEPNPSKSASNDSLSSAKNLSSRPKTIAPRSKDQSSEAKEHATGAHRKEDVSFEYRGKNPFDDDSDTGESEPAVAARKPSPLISRTASPQRKSDNGAVSFEYRGKNPFDMDCDDDSGSYTSGSLRTSVLRKKRHAPPPPSSRPPRPEAGGDLNGSGHASPKNSDVSEGASKGPDPAPSEMSPSSSTSGHESSLTEAPTRRRITPQLEDDSPAPIVRALRPIRPPADLHISSDEGEADDESPSPPAADPPPPPLPLAEGAAEQHETESNTSDPWVRKGPAPAQPVAARRCVRTDADEEFVAYSDLIAELERLNEEQVMMENKGRQLEAELRNSDKRQHSCPEEAESVESDAKVDVLMGSWLELIEKKNELFRRENELHYRIRQRELEERHADIEYELRQLLAKQEHVKTAADRRREEVLLQDLQACVMERAELVYALDEDQQRNLEDDKHRTRVLGPKFTNVLCLSSKSKKKNKEGKKRDKKERKKEKKKT